MHSLKVAKSKLPTPNPPPSPSKTNGLISNATKLRAHTRDPRQGRENARAQVTIDFSFEPD